MKKHLLPLALLFSGISPAQALDVGDISSFMNSDSSTLSKTIKNSTDSGRLINIRLERLSSPLDDGQVSCLIFCRPHHSRRGLSVSVQLH